MLQWALQYPVTGPYQNNGPLISIQGYKNQTKAETTSHLIDVLKTKIPAPISTTPTMPIKTAAVKAIIYHPQW